MTTEARIRPNGEKRMWCCPECGRIMGEVTATRLVVIVRKFQRITFALADGMEMTCPHCHAVSVYRKSERSATIPN